MERTSSRRRRYAAVAVSLVVATLVGGAAFGGVAAASGSGVGDVATTDGEVANEAVSIAHADGALADTNDPVDGFDEDPEESLTGCFVGEGYPLEIGDPPTTIDGAVHFSVLTDAGTANEFGVELAGTIGEDRIVTLAAGVRLSRAGLLESGLNPFAAFDVLYTYELRLPMFDGAIEETSYEEEGSPVASAAGVVPC